MNAIDKQMLRELQDALDDVERDDALRVLIVQGAGGNFSSGFDLKEQMETRPSGFAAWREILDRDFSTVTRFWHLKKPTIAAVRGYCLASACELALICDITIAAEDAIFGEPELKFGAGIVVMILPWLIGPKRAKEIILTGLDRIPAVEAARIGLINRVVPGNQLENEVRKAAATANMHSKIAPAMSLYSLAIFIGCGWLWSRRQNNPAALIAASTTRQV
jgi:enoyl-CoA hydratase